MVTKNDKIRALDDKIQDLQSDEGKMEITDLIVGQNAMSCEVHDSTSILLKFRQL